MPKSKVIPDSSVEEMAQPVAQEPEKEKKSKKEKKKFKAVAHGPLCKLSKSGFVEDHFKEYKALVVPPAYICKKCGRAAADKKSLCKPARIE